MSDAFPDARVLAAPETIDAINTNVRKKIKVWAPQLGDNGPQSLDDIVFAEPHEEASLNLEGSTIEIVTSELMKDRRYLWLPSIDAVVGGVYTFDGLHVWTADTPTPQSRNAWIRELDALIALNPAVVIAGHAVQGINNGTASLRFTREYLLAFEDEVTKAKDSEQLIAAMKQRYPNLGLVPGLEISAKVAKGEMDWG